MHFKRLEIFGFKSFANQTLLDFHPGITAIVGPNGCGKSNVSDSIKWVLGEQSAKSLRGHRMEDVIFNGTATTEPVNFAEVAITLTNENKELPIDFEEVTIARRLYRNGDSEYLLNRTPVRLRDIQSLLAGTGLGVGNYSVIEQGRIDQVLSAKPEDRRELFEEAAGITRYKSKKKEALRNLEVTEQNLARVSDIVAELGRQIASLERQAKKAEKYKREYERLKDHDIRTALSDAATLVEKINASDAALTRWREEIQTAGQAVSGMNGKLVEARDLLQTIDQRYSEVKAQHLIAENQINSVREKSEIYENYIREAQQNLLLLEQAAEQIRARIAGHEGETTAATEEVTKSESGIQEVQAEIEALTVHVNSQKDQKLQAEESLKQIEESHKRCQSALSELAANISSEKSRLEILEGMTSRHEGYSQGAQMLLREKQSHPELGIMTALADVVDVQSGYELALEMALETVHEAILCEKEADVLACATFLAERQGGKAVLISNERLREVRSSNRIQDNNAVCLSDVARGREGYSATFENLTQSTYVVEDAQTGLTLSRQHPNCTFVTRSGIVYRDAVTILASNKTNQQSLLFGRRNRIEELTSRLEALQSDKLRLEDERATLVAQMTTWKYNVQQFQKELPELQVHLAEKRKQLEAIYEKRRQADLQLRRIQEARYREEEELTKKLRESTELVERRQDTEQKCAELKNLAVEYAAQRDHLHEEFNRMSSERRESALAVERLEAEQRELQRVLSAAQTGSHDEELALQKVRHEAERLKERISDQYQFNLETDTYTPRVLEEGEEALAAEEVEPLREKLAKYGPVNLIAVEEHHELNERFSFLSREKEDLINAKEDIHKAILKINRTTREVFAETFEKIRVHFIEHFKLLFGGGNADIVLLDEGDVLDCGIEIVARPPGKKLQSLSLMSGGEKALTSIALLFAVFRVKPSPFCVLDEIDAPLDDANVQRYANSLKDFIKDSQFIVITHNKHTMAVAQSLYGVTMEKSGISKVVSVRFAEAVKVAQPAAAEEVPQEVTA